MTFNLKKTKTYGIEDLPDEVLEFILSLIPPYKDLHDCLAVSKRWKRCVLSEYVYIVLVYIMLYVVLVM